MVGLKVGPIFYKIGRGSFLHCFFSTVAVRIESENWGDKYPVLMNQLYKGEVLSKDVDSLKNELNDIKAKFKDIEIDQVVWSIEDRSQQPPWGDKVTETITNLSNCFITSGGKDLFEVFYTAIEASQRVNRNLIIKSL